ncbi:MAG: oxidative damage protection protein [Gammaproteobacteria bacterium]|nr:oxidative damage protection protein [Gammaproteobacteria bacterium]
MTRMIDCLKLGIQAEGLEEPPFPGQKGMEIFENISRQAWQQWLEHQTMVINENRLTPFEPEAKRMLETERDKFLFGEGVDKPEGYKPPETA